MEQRLRRIEQKIRTTGKKLNPVLSEKDITDFESRHRIVLPEGYRQFLLQIGNGGDGPPSYKLVRLGTGPASSSKKEVRYWKELPHVHLVFPFRNAWVWERGDGSEEGSPEQVRHGSLFLGEDGCGMDWHLIITGAERGNVWLLTGAGITPTNPKRDFLRWYEDWLDGIEDWWGVKQSGSPSDPPR